MAIFVAASHEAAYRGCMDNSMQTPRLRSHARPATRPGGEPEQPAGILADADRMVLDAVLSQTSECQRDARARQRTETAAPLVWTLPGFEGKCRITTIFGELPVEALRRRDQVRTICGAFKEVKKVEAIRLDADFLERHPAAQPVMIRARAMGGAFPVRHMLVSPAQKLWLSRPGEGFAARTAQQMEGTPNMLRTRRSDITYYRFHLGEEEMVSVEGAWFCTTPF